MIERLIELKLENFRAFSGKHSVPLDADVVLLHGSNGVGKSSLLSALELGMTGSVEDLQRFKEDYPRCLKHAQAESGWIQLVCRRDSVEKKSLIRLEAPLPGPPIPVDEVEYFRERCYLSQSSLSRLLEIYQTPSSSDAGRELPLVRFLKKILRLEIPEYLIEGLKVAATVNTVKKEAPAYQLLKERVETELPAKLLQAKRDMERKEADWREHEERLRELMAAADLELPETLSTRNLPRIREDLLQKTEVCRQELEGLRKQIAHNEFNKKSLKIQHEPLSSLPLVPPEAQSSIRELRTRRRNLKAKLVLVAVALEDELSETSVSKDFTERLKTLQSAADVAILECSIRIEFGREGARKLDELKKEKSHLRQEARQLEAPEKAAHDDRKQERWVQALHSVLERLRIESCPICDRDYSELGKGSLEAKIRNELVQIDTDLVDRRRREEQRAELEVRLSELEQETKAWQARMDRAPTEEAQSRLSRLSELKSQLDWQAWISLERELEAAEGSYQ